MSRSFSLRPRQRADDAGQARLAASACPGRRSPTRAAARARASQSTQVSLGHSSRLSAVTVRNDGTPQAASGGDDGRRGGPVEGTGLLRLRDRVEAVGGSLDWGQADGGWRVAATVPRTRGEG